MTEESFEIERDAVGGGAFVALTTTLSNATTAPDATALHSTSYRYRVRAVNRYGASAWSNEAEVTLPACADVDQDDDNDGRCQPTCTSSALMCGVGGTCSHASGTAMCVCSPGYSGTDCAQCAGGYQDRDGNGTCTETCTTAALSCANHGVCDDVSGTALCQCEAGFAGGGTTSCADIDECLSGNGGCDALTACINTSGSRSCGACPGGYAGSGETACLDIDECASGNGGCDVLTVCSNTAGARTCSACPTGYNGSGDTSCVDVDECASGNGGCDALTVCTNTAGARSCGACPSGYSGTGETACVDIDECASGNGGCDALTVCSNTAGARTCSACPSGYSGTGETACVDIDECASGNGGCDVLTVCSNTAGTRTCSACPTGYTGSGDTSCVNVNECLDGSNTCSPNATCTDANGSYSCACNSGYTGDGSTCTVISGCDTNHGGCDVNATCTGTGSTTNTCACNSGYVGSGKTCSVADAAITFRHATRRVGANVGSVTIDVTRSEFGSASAEVPYSLSGTCIGTNADGVIAFAHGQGWQTLTLTIDPACAASDTLVVALGTPSSPLPISIGAIASHSIVIVAANRCTTQYPNLNVDSPEDLDSDGVPDRCDDSLAPAGQVSLYLEPASSSASTEYGGSLAASHAIVPTLNAAPSPTSFIFSHNWSGDYSNAGSWLNATSSLTQWYAVAFAAPVTVDELSLINFANSGRNLEWMRGVKAFNVYGTNALATAAPSGASVDSSMVLVGSYSAASFNDRSWQGSNGIVGLPQVFRLSAPGQYQYYHFEIVSSQRTDWSGQYPGDLTGFRKIELAHYAVSACTVGNGGCDVNAQCTDNRGTISCACEPGYYGNGSACTTLAFDPKTISGLKAWVAADVVAPDAGVVSSWRDMSGHGNHFEQAELGRQPSLDLTGLAGRPALKFEANAGQFLVMPSNTPAPATVCYVARMWGPAHGRVLSGQNNWLLGYWGGSQDTAYFEGWITGAHSPASTNSAVYCGVMRGSGSDFYKNGQLVVSNSSGGVQGPNGLSVGSGFGEYSDSEVAEVLVYERALDTLEMADLNGYLALKYPSCTDGVKNGGEVDIDCGGSCSATCADNQQCVTNADCTNGLCDAQSLTCGPPGARIYDYTGNVQTLIVPAGRTVNIKVWGAGGQNGGYTSLGGGGGGFTSGQIIGTGQTLKVLVGEGANGNGGRAFFGGGGMSGGCGPSGGGGGRSQVSLGDGTALFVAGGGGGAGPGAGAFGGGGCGVHGGGSGDAIGGVGGTTTTGFAQYLGENADDSGAAGGGGWYGGYKGGGLGCNVGGGGGGGSCYLAASVIGGAQFAGSGTVPGGSSVRNRGSAGQGGVSSNAAGSHGRVIISWGTGLSCGSNNGGCDVNATCSDSGQGTVSCACNVDYAGDGQTCVSILEPLQANLASWVTADRGLTMNGSTVSSWADQSGHGNDFSQAGAGQQPTVDPVGIGGRPALEFIGNAGQVLVSPTNYTAPVTVCMVARMSGPRRERVLSGVWNNWLLGWHQGRQDRAFFEGWVVVSEAPATLMPVLYCSVIDGSVSSFYRNGTLLGANNGGIQGPNGLSIGGAGGEVSDAQVAEVLVYSAALGQNDREQVEAYLMAKYGL